MLLAVDTSTAQVGLALYDGARMDRNGQKSVTVWHVLEIER